MLYLTLTALASLALSSTVHACEPISGVTHTFYGFPDNDPPGPATAYDCGRGYVAGGTGTFSDPLTFASAPGEFASCEVIYDPYLQKYLRYEDYCAQCTTDWSSGVWHIDVWTGSTTNSGGENQIQCENALTPDAQTIVRSPPADLPVDATALYDPDTRTCATDHTYHSYDIGAYC